MKNLIENVGELVRELRLLQKVSLRTLAKRIDRSPSFLSQLERNISKPSLKDIYAIAGALNRPASLSCRMFLLCPPEEKGHAVRKKHRRRMESQGIIAEILSPKLSKGVDFNQTAFLPLARTEQKKCDQPGFETGVLVSGQSQMHLEGRSSDRSVGDSHSLRVDQAHFSMNPSLDHPAVPGWTVTYLQSRDSRCNSKAFRPRVTVDCDGFFEH